MHANHPTYAQWLITRQWRIAFPTNCTNSLVQKAALALQEQERVANEEEEKRLKAALKAKREPSAATSRVSSPGIGATGGTKDAAVEQKPPVLDASSTEYATMETDPPAVRFRSVVQIWHRS